MVLCITRYLIIGYWTWDINNDNASDMIAYQDYACDCYFVSMNPHLYDKQIPGDVRFDLAHEVPYCTDCSECNKVYNDTGICIFLSVQALYIHYITRT